MFNLYRIRTTLILSMLFVIFTFGFCFQSDTPALAVYCCTHVEECVEFSYLSPVTYQCCTTGDYCLFRLYRNCHDYSYQSQASCPRLEAPCDPTYPGIYQNSYGNPVTRRTYKYVPHYCDPPNDCEEDPQWRSRGPNENCSSSTSGAHDLCPCAP